MRINVIATFVLSIAISLLVVLLYDKYKIKPRNPILYSIDAKSIMEKERNKIKDRIFKNNEKVKSQEIIDYLMKINNIVYQIAKRDNAIVLVKDAVASDNVKDITRDVLKIYKMKYGKE